MEKHIKTTNKVIKFGRVRWVAASAIFALIAGLCFVSPPNNEQVFDNHFMAFEDNISGELDLIISTRGASDDTPQSILLIKEGMDLYNEKDYNKAIPIFKDYLKNNTNASDFNQIELYLAVSLLSNGETEQSTVILEKLVALNKRIIKEDATWYLSLAYARTGKIDEAKVQLENLSNSEKYSDKVNKILDPTKTKDKVAFK
jgi:tetratricopeptide (TPR) repeat protein